MRQLEDNEVRIHIIVSKRTRDKFRKISYPGEQYNETFKRIVNELIANKLEDL